MPFSQPSTVANGRAITVNGPIDAAELGPTLVHEHLLIELEVWLTPPATDEARRIAGQPVGPAIAEALAADPFAVRDNLRLDDLDLAASELTLFAQAGGRSVVDLTLPDIGRDPMRLRELANRTGLNVIMGCGHYIHDAHPGWLSGESGEHIAERLLRELREGVPVGDGVPIRPGVIGEIGTSDPITPREQTVLEAAADVQRQTGAPLFIHLDPWGRAGHRALDIAEAAGADPRRVALCHLDPTIPDFAYHRTLAERGATVCYDTWGDEAAYGGKGLPSDAQRIMAIETALAEGWIDRVAVSQDVCAKTLLRVHGGPGYAHLSTRIAAELARRGHGPALLHTLLIETPRRLLAWA